MKIQLQMVIVWDWYVVTNCRDKLQSWYVNFGKKHNVSEMLSSWKVQYLPKNDFERVKIMQANFEILRTHFWM